MSLKISGFQKEMDTSEILYESKYLQKVIFEKFEAAV